MTRAILAGVWIVLAGLARAESPVHQSYDERAFVASKLRQYCSACHAIGNLKFIPGGNDDELWDTILHASPPDSREVWAQRIVELLNWPTDTAPDVVTEPEWMPKGAKRLQMALDSQSGQSVRKIILRTLQTACPP